MATLHEKSICCGALVYRFGGKRRRCTMCGRTWSVHPSRVGRKSSRTGTGLARRLILGDVSARQISCKQHCSTSTVYRRCRQSIIRLLGQSELPGLPAVVDLVLVVDGLRFHIRGEHWVHYTMALKPVDAEVAYFADPVLLSGGESAANWQQVFESIRPEVAGRIRALVADGLRGMKETAAQSGWVYQRCHFHIRALLRYWLDGPWVDANDDALRWAIDDALLSADEQRADVARAALAAHVRDQRRGGLSCILRQMIRDWDAIRAYLRYPYLGIPRTTGTVESMHSRLRDVVRGVSRIHAVLCRSAAYIRLHEPFECKPGKFQQH